MLPRDDIVSIVPSIPEHGPARERNGFRRFAHTREFDPAKERGRSVGGPSADDRARLGLVLAGKIERGCHSAGIRLSAHVVRIYRKIDIGSETMVLPMQRY